MALWRYALGLLCLLQAVPVTAQSDPSHIAFGDGLNMRHPLSSLHTLHTLHTLYPLAAVRSVGANSTAPGAPGSVCTAEGEWNCLTTCWQRCASGQWSDSMALAPGTVCTPAGLSYEMAVVGSRRSTGDTSDTSDRTSETTAGALATILAATTGLCQCTVAGCSATSPSTSVAATTSPATTMTTTTSSQETPTGGEFVSGSSSAATQQPTSAVTVVLGVSLLAVVFARLLM
ncbi:hypothetical protein SPBR_03232 [Sporothrix brasiliensis 5110]|uniref:Uncharacterized protein n=1 Tax=Sporothrix brasiliensis 5110 TaxID=1398154 RepID=A0A0C2IUI2_9PEZI|nr:uncharacterized protein SPBR_03232 [Sporothrix brasiliensis 5110]KIH92806.1 hypothetical protein SPBR_03232 [Sporothrix brasiliensis 5110]